MYSSSKVMKRKRATGNVESDEDMEDFLLAVFEKQLRKAGSDKSLKATSWKAINRAIIDRYPSRKELFTPIYVNLTNKYLLFMSVITHLFHFNRDSYSGWDAT
jgi:hypothetical protein